VAINLQSMTRDRDGDEGRFFWTYFKGRENERFLATASGQQLRTWQDWLRLPPGERKPGAIQVPDRSDGKRAEPQPPAGGLIAKVYLRPFVRSTSGRFSYDKILYLGNGRYESEPGRDHLWLTEAEWRSLVPADPRPGDSFPLPGPVLQRIVRYHLLFAPNGVVGAAWSVRALRTASARLTVEEVRPESLQLRLDGSVLLARPDGAEVAQSASGYDARLAGRLTFSRREGAFSRFDLVAFGEGWSRTRAWEKRPAPPRTDGPERFWFGVALELVPPDQVAKNLSLAPPYLLLRDGNDYFGTGR
jgi:hypothetical protein